MYVRIYMYVWSVCYSCLHWNRLLQVKVDGGETQPISSRDNQERSRSSMEPARPDWVSPLKGLCQEIKQKTKLFKLKHGSDPSKPTSAPTEMSTRKLRPQPRRLPVKVDAERVLMGPHPGPTHPGAHPPSYHPSSVDKPHIPVAM